MSWKRMWPTRKLAWLCRSVRLTRWSCPFALNQTGKLSAIIGMPVELTCDLLEQAGVVVEVDPIGVELSLHGMKVGIEQ